MLSFSQVVGIGTPNPSLDSESGVEKGDLHCGTLYIYVLCVSDLQKRGAVQRDSAEDSLLQMAGRQEGGGQKHVSITFSLETQLDVVFVCR